MNSNYHSKPNKSKSKKLHTFEVIHRCEPSKKTRVKASLAEFGGSFHHYATHMHNTGFIWVMPVN